MTFKESDLLHAWLWDQHRTDTQWRRVRLGIAPTKEMARAYMVILRWADAIFLKDGIVNIVEAKLRPSPGAIGQLELYEKLFKATPEFDQYKDWPIKKILLASVPDLQILDLTGEKGIDMIIFTQREVNKVRSELGQQIV